MKLFSLVWGIRGLMPLSEASAAPASEPRILVVEDEPLIRFAIAEALRELDVCVVEAATADEAWGYLASGGQADLVFTDHLMPGSMTGGQLAVRISQQYPALKVIVVSAYFNDRGWSGRVVRKPYKLQETAVELAELAAQSNRNRIER